MKIGDRVIHPKGSLLTLNAQDATEKSTANRCWPMGIAESLPDLVKMAGLKGDVVQFEPSGFEQLAFWLTALAPLLLLGGILGAYLEFKIPGFGLAGIISVVCFALFFLGHYFAGARLAGKVVGLFVLGVVFVLVEILVFRHSTIVFGVVGVLLIVRLAPLGDGRSRYPGQKFFPTGQMLKIPLLNMLLTFRRRGPDCDSRSLSPADEHLSPFHSLDRPIRLAPRWQGAHALVCHVTSACAGNARALPNDSAAERKGGIRESRRRCGDRRRIHRAGNAGRTIVSTDGMRVVVRRSLPRDPPSASQLTRGRYSLTPRFCSSLSARSISWCVVSSDSAAVQQLDTSDLRWLGESSLVALTRCDHRPRLAPLPATPLALAGFSSRSSTCWRGLCSHSFCPR